MIVGAAYYQTRLKGPEFTTQFTYFGLYVLVGGLIIRMIAPGQLAGYVVAALVTWEAIAVLRLVYGLNHGMHKFGNLKLMMVMGPFAMLFLAFMKFSNGAGSSYNTGCGSSCGGGCGGGGCGGCS